MIQRFSLGLALILIAAVALAGCRGGSGGRKTPAPLTATTGAEPSATPGLAQAVRGVLLRDVDEVKSLEARSGGATVDQQLVTYADVTGDGNEEAVVPVTLSDNQGIVGFVVLTMDGTRPRGILTELPREGRGRLTVKVDAGKVVETQGVPGPDDPECCPANLKVTTWAWNGTALVAESVNTIPNPAGGIKGTPPVP